MIIGSLYKQISRLRVPFLHGLNRCFVLQTTDAQAKLDVCARKYRMATSIALGLRKSLHALVQPDGARTSHFEGAVVLESVDCLVSPLVWFVVLICSHFDGISERWSQIFANKPQQLNHSVGLSQYHILQRCGVGFRHIGVSTY